MFGLIYVARDRYGFLLSEQEPQLTHLWDSRRCGLVRCFDRSRALAVFVDPRGVGRLGIDLDVDQVKPASLAVLEPTTRG